MKHRGLIGAIFWLVIGILLTIRSTHYQIGSIAQPGPGFFPLGIGLLLAFLSVVIAVGEARSSLNAQKTALPTDGGWKKVVCTVSILILAAFFFETIGYLLTFFFLILLLMSVAGGQSWKTTLLIAFCTVLGVYLIFVVLLRQQFPGGLLRV